MRIALTGPSSSGKSTLMDRLCINNPSLKKIQVETREIFDKYGIVNQRQSVIDASSYPDKFKLMYTDLITSRYTKFSENTNFITDRMPVDSLIYYKLQHSFFDLSADETIQAFSSISLETCRLFDHIFLLPPSKEFSLLDSNNSMRNSNHAYNEMMYTLLYSWFVQSKLSNVYLLTKQDLLERVEEVESVMVNHSYLEYKC